MDVVKNAQKHAVPMGKALNEARVYRSTEPPTKVKADAPSKGKQEGRQAGSRAGRQGLGRVDTIQERKTSWETAGRSWETRGYNGRQGLGKRTHHPTQARMWGDNKRQAGGQRGDKSSGRRTHLLTQARLWGDKGRQDFGKADAPSNKWKRRQGLGKVDTIQERKTSWETAGRSWETRGYNGRQGLGKRTHHPTQARMWGDNKRQVGGQGETSPREGGHTC